MEIKWISCCCRQSYYQTHTHTHTHVPELYLQYHCKHRAESILCVDPVYEDTSDVLTSNTEFLNTSKVARSYNTLTLTLTLIDPVQIIGSCAGRFVEHGCIICVDFIQNSLLKCQISLKLLNDVTYFGPAADSKICLFSCVM